MLLKLMKNPEVLSPTNNLSKKMTSKFTRGTDESLR